MKNKIKLISLIFVLSIAFIFSGCGCRKKAVPSPMISLEIWGIVDQEGALGEIFNNYKKVNPNITGIEYKKLPPDTYKQDLIDALATGQGPDIFMINNTWLPAFENKIVPAPQDPRVLNEQKFRANFVDVVADDFLVRGKIYGVPLAVNTLGLYYNKDLFNQAGIVNPPTNWNEFIDDVIRMTQIDEWGNITQSGAAIGTATNINRSTDILTLLMLQNGTKMTNEAGVAEFEKSVSINGKSVSSGENALNFYTQFSKVGSLNYTWNNNMHYSIDAFAEGKTAMMFNYPWNIAVVQNKAPKLNFAVAQVPQFEDSPRANYANYQVFVVAKNKIAKTSLANATISDATRVKETWNFLTYLTTAPDGSFVAKSDSGPGAGLGQVVDSNFDPAKSYLAKSGEPAARRDLIELQKSDPVIGAFAKDNLIAKSWRQPDSNAVEIIFAEIIEQINLGQITVSEGLKLAATKVKILSR